MMSTEIKKVRCKAEYGIWCYAIIYPSCINDLDAPVYRLFDKDENFVNDFASYGDMKNFIEKGVAI